MRSSTPRILRTLCAAGVASALLGSAAQAGAKNGKVEIVWSDVEGGAATLIVTPSGESVLVDTGNPGDRDAGRIYKACTNAGLSRIDHMVITHFHSDHFGGAAELARLIPFGTLWDHGMPKGDPDGNPNPANFQNASKPYREIKAERRAVIKPGAELPLRQTKSGPKVSVRCLAAEQKFIEKPTAPTSDCANAVEKPKDLSDNANSVVLLVEFGGFHLYMGGDLTWNLEKQLICPVNLVGEVDVYQVTHHGLDQSNNPLLLRALKPTVSIMSNGTAKGCQPQTFATLKSTPSIQAMYQIHANLRPDHENNTAPENIANLEKNCAGLPIELSVAADSKSYTVSIPEKGSRTFQTK